MLSTGQLLWLLSPNATCAAQLQTKWLSTRDGAVTEDTAALTLSQGESRERGRERGEMVGEGEEEKETESEV